MKILFILSFSLGACLSVWSQSITPIVIGSTGGDFTSSEAQLSWTVGEPVTETVTNDDIITQGFHQPYDRHHIGISSMEESGTITLYPNPTADQLTISFDQNTEGYLLRWYNALGQIVLKTTVEADQNELQIDLSELASGQYTLLANDLSDGSINTYKIQKVL